jgi:hypothetical protein
MPAHAKSMTVPKAMQATYEAISALTDAVCHDHLNEEYRNLSRTMVAALCRKRPSPLASGQARTWACGIVCALGQVNFLSDNAQQPSMTMAELAAVFGVGPSTASAKAKVISKALGLGPFEPSWTLPSLMDQNPLIWLAELDGLVVDLRNMPRAVQALAFEQGLIPYVPADRDDAKFG